MVSEEGYAECAATEGMTYVRVVLEWLEREGPQIDSKLEKGFSAWNVTGQEKGDLYESVGVLLLAPLLNKLVAQAVGVGTDLGKNT